jgi:hypothetical protein
VQDGMDDVRVGADDAGGDLRNDSVGGQWSPRSEGPHAPLWAVLRRLPSDFQPYGERDREDDWGPDCSCGCRWYVPLQGDLAADWGVCTNPESPRAGLLTWEHQGCHQFQEGADVTPEDTTAAG